MTTSRTRTHRAFTSLSLLAVAAFSCGSLLPRAAHADFQASDLTETLSTLTNGTSEAAVASNVSALQSKLAEITAQIGQGGTSAEVAQLNAVASALQGIITRLQQGLSITSYTTTSDEATLETTVTIGFTDASGNASTFTVVLPSADGTDSTGSDDEEEEEDSEEDSESSSNSDMLTQVLQQLASSLMGGGNNPFSNIQGTLNNLTSPVEALTGALTDAATAAAAGAALTCSPDGMKATAGDGVAVYDSSTGKLYMPDGSVLQSNSGLGSYMNNPAAANIKGQGPIPTGVYTVGARAKGLFHGVEAVALTPSGSNNMYGRNGFLIHPPMRRGSLGSAGCIAVATDYARVLAAFKSGQLKKVVVVSSAADAQKYCTPPQVDTPNPTSS